MERLRVVKISELTPPQYSIKEPAESIIKMKLDAFIKKFGQFQQVVIATVDGVLKIVDGNQIYECLKRAEIEDVQCFDLGEITEKEYFVYRVFLNTNTNRLNYIGIAEIVNKIAVNEHDLSYISNATGIDINDVRRYKDLLKFDWEAFAKSPLGSDQFNLFGEDEVEVVERVIKSHGPPVEAAKTIVKTEADEISKEDLEAAAEKYDEVRKEQAEKFKDVGGISNVAPVIIQEAPKKSLIDFTKVDAAIEKKDWMIARFWINDILTKYPDNELVLAKQEEINVLDPIIPKVVEPKVEEPKEEKELWVVIEDFQSEGNRSCVSEVDYQKRSMVETIMFTGGLPECRTWIAQNPYKE